ncbi:hypothetical protein SAMN05216368_11223 [Cryobacterium flavum]|uniref:Lipoprotein n=2 Tax=Cryobacterium flavum TaxID=1424659 RepID=A0A5E9G2M8_9MICO|nr:MULTISPECIES: hypothetical protein [Cryobacterium]TFD09951.1 hypothetical protein E3T35_13150 [Cryobacterium sp. TMT1-2-2]SDO18896.1 hypothetical protein SAMN05216368_11223 [Cryobacterium flavum]
MNRQGKTTAITGLLILIAVLTSCAPTNQGSETTMDLQTAKGIAMALEDETAALVPSENVGDQSQLQMTYLLGCANDTLAWPGRTTVTLVGDVDAEAMIDVIASAWEQKDGVVVERRKTRQGAPRVDMTGVQGDFYSASIWAPGTELQITSFSPCFELEGGTKPGMKY